MSECITIEDNEYGIQVELHPKENHIEVYVGSSFQGTIGANALSAIAKSERVVIPEKIQSSNL